MKEKKTFSAWVSEHKKGIIITSVGIAVVAGTILVGKNWDAISKLAVRSAEGKSQNKLPIGAQAAVPDMPVQVPSDKPQIMTISEVRSFVRNLPEGHHPSAEKVATAAENGFELIENQTWVEPFTRKIAA